MIIDNKHTLLYLELLSLNQGITHTLCSCSQGQADFHRSLELRSFICLRSDPPRLREKGQGERVSPVAAELVLDFNPNFGEGMDHTDRLRITSTDFDTLSI